MEMSVSMTPALEALFTGISGSIQLGIDAGMRNLVADVEAVSLDEVPVRTGNLHASITSYIAGRTGVVKATAKYAAFVHEGTKPHVIRPKNKRALFWPGAVQPAKAVRHPGTRPNPFFTRALEKVDVQHSFDVGIEQAMKWRE